MIVVFPVSLSFPSPPLFFFPLPVNAKVEFSPEGSGVGSFIVTASPSPFFFLLLEQAAEVFPILIVGDWREKAVCLAPPFLFPFFPFFPPPPTIIAKLEVR